MKTCDDVREKLIEYQDNTLEASEAANVAAHLEQCSECQAELEAIRALFGSLRDSDPADPGEVFWKKFRNQVQERIQAQEQPAARTVTRRARRFPAAAARMAVAAALLVAVFAGYRIFNKPAVVPPSVTPAKPAATAAKNPAPVEHTHEERVLMATLGSASIAPVDRVASEIKEQNAQQQTSAQTGSDNTAEAEAAQEFPFDVDDTAALAAQLDDTIYLFDDSLTGEYIIPDVLDDLTQEEAQAVLDSFENGSSALPPETPGGVS